MGKPTDLLPGERLAFRIAAAVIVVHSLLHAFVFVRPGAARSGHLLAAFVACGMLVAAAALYEHLGAGRRASLALLIGAPTLVAGVVAVVDATRGGSLVRDLTGFILLPTAVALLGVGAGYSGHRANAAGVSGGAWADAHSSPSPLSSSPTG